MDSNDIYNFLEVIAEEPGKKAKINWLREFLQDPDFRKVVQYAYDPLVTFGVLKLSETSHGVRGFNDDTWVLLDLLKDREITGNAAKDCIYNELQNLDVESQTLFRRILKKDLRGGFSVKSINEAMSGLIPEFPYMRCSTGGAEDWDYTDGIYCQEKADGLFVNVNMLDWEKPLLVSRYGQVFPKGIGEDVLDRLCDGYQYHGEIIVYEDGKALPRKTSNGVANSLLKGGKLAALQELRFFLWDMIPLEIIRTGMKYSVPYEDRFTMLCKEVAKCKNHSVEVIDTVKVYSWDEAEGIFERVTEMGKEGTVLKKPTAEWKDGTSKDQVKRKKEKECELRIIGFIPGKGKFSGKIGSFICVSEDGEVSVNVSGMTEEERYKGEEYWLDKIITVRFTEVIQDKYLDGWSLFSPRFIEERFDKDRADTTEYILRL